MRKTVSFETLVNKEKLTEICCNKCGRATKFEDDSDTDYSINEYQTINVGFGYGSRFDMQSWSFELCEDCLVDLLKTFKYSPSGFGQDSYYAYNEQQTFEDWKETGIIDLEAGATKEEIAANGGSIYGETEEDDYMCCMEEMVLNHRINNENKREFGYSCLKCGHSEWELEK